MSRPARRLPAATPVYRVALVSGANRGLGFEVARQLSERGMTVLLGARDLDKGLHAARQLAGAPGEVIAVQLDVTRQDQVDTLARWIDRFFPERTPDVIVFGDTHRECIAEVDGILCVNPGSATYPHNYDTQYGTIGFLELEDGAARASVWQITDGGIEPFDWHGVPPWKRR